MTTKIALIGGWVLLQITAFGGVIWLMTHDEFALPPTMGITPKFEPRVDILTGAPQVPMTGSGWRLTHQLSAHYALILSIEAEILADAMAIAQHLVEPVKSKYVEVIVYFYPAGSRNGRPDRRVQWTEATGYVEVDLRE